MSDPWVSDPNLFGAIWGMAAGGLGGTLIGCLGAAAGKLVPQGRGRAWMVGALRLVIALGLVQAAAGVYAVADGQPYGICYPLLLVGLGYAIVAAVVLPVVVRGYAAAEQRRLDAQAIRNS